MSKVIVITGAGAGLGRSLARSFAADGDKVVLLGRTVSKVQAGAQEIRGGGAIAVGCDISSPDSVRAAFAEIARTHPKIDVLINNAAIFEPFLIAEATDEQILGTIATNLSGPILCTRSAIPLLQGGGHIINISSESVDMVYPHLTMYQSAKAGLERFSKSMSAELESSGIRVTVVRAGAMFEEGKTWDVDPAVAMRFAQACGAVGLNLRERPITHVKSVAHVFRALIDLPADLHADVVSLHAWR